MFYNVLFAAANTIGNLFTYVIFRGKKEIKKMIEINKTSHKMTRFCDLSYEKQQKVYENEVDKMIKTINKFNKDRQAKTVEIQIPCDMMSTLYFHQLGDYLKHICHNHFTVFSLGGGGHPMEDDPQWIPCDQLNIGYYSYMGLFQVHKRQSKPVMFEHNLFDGIV